MHFARKLFATSVIAAAGAIPVALALSAPAMADPVPAPAPAIPGVPGMSLLSSAPQMLQNAPQMLQGLASMFSGTAAPRGRRGPGRCRTRCDRVGHPAAGSGRSCGSAEHARRACRGRASRRRCLPRRA